MRARRIPNGSLCRKKFIVKLLRSFTIQRASIWWRRASF
ncbi:hypothetical protein CDS [Bradyrhizobium sp.]|nr:hypothetical protein CDS [Bradyrhizobium sp.]